MKTGLTEQVQQEATIIEEMKRSEVNRGSSFFFVRQTGHIGRFPYRVGRLSCGETHWTDDVDETIIKETQRPMSTGAHLKILLVGGSK